MEKVTDQYTDQIFINEIGKSLNISVKCNNNTNIDNFKNAHALLLRFISLNKDVSISGPPNVTSGWPNAECIKTVLIHNFNNNGVKRL